MTVGVFSLLRVGIGPSSSHTVGPMRAAGLWLDDLVRPGPVAAGTVAQPCLRDITGLTVDLLGSLGATGRGYGTDRAVVAGLMGARPETVSPDFVETALEQVTRTRQVVLRAGTPPIEQVLAGFDPAVDIHYRASERLAYHPNALRFTATTADGSAWVRVFYSIGGGFVVAADAAGQPLAAASDNEPDLPYPFTTGGELLERCGESGLSIAELMLRNEVARGRSRHEVEAGLLDLWAVMAECIRAGCQTEGLLPGPLKVRRRAAAMLRTLKHRPAADPMAALDWVSLWALAVNEQNAAGGRVVTAPTNGAAGIVPAVLKYVIDFLPGSDDHTVVDFLLTACAIGSIYQATASISGAEVGCQGEIGVASSMAAAGLAQVLGGSVQQVVNAAEIGMEHHLGLTCDPVAGLVQIPCIERNAIGATTALTAARLALAGDGRQIVSLDDVIATMMATGRDMTTKYKETAEGGLAVSVVTC